MNFTEVYNKTIKFYPVEISISDGVLVNKGSGDFKRVLAAYSNAEVKAENEANFVKVMVWAIFCAFQNKSIDNYLKGKKTVSSSELDLEYVKNKFNVSLLNLNITLD